MTEITIDEKLAELESTLDKYSQSLSVNVKTNPEFQIITNLTLDEIKKLDSETCHEYGVLASIFSMHIQKEINSISAKLGWCRHNLEVVIAKYCSSYGDKYTKFEERSNAVKVDNEHAVKLNALIKDLAARAETLNFISRKIETIFSALTELGKSKRKYYAN